jgi:hypothetical protein
LSKCKIHFYSKDNSCLTSSRQSMTSLMCLSSNRPGTYCSRLRIPCK